MKIYTSYFARLKNLPPNTVPISIALYNPKWYSGKEYRALNPNSLTLRSYKEGRISEGEYRLAYNNTVLGKLSATDVLNDLSKMSDGKDVILLCYEKSDDFCHRHLVSAWFRGNGVECDELDF